MNQLNVRIAGLNPETQKHEMEKIAHFADIQFAYAGGLKGLDAPIDVAVIVTPHTYSVHVSTVLNHNDPGSHHLIETTHRYGRITDGISLDDIHALLNVAASSLVSMVRAF